MIEINDKPKLARPDYKKRYKEPLILSVTQPDVIIYRGTGTAVIGHPLRRSCGISKQCANCGSKNIEVIYAKHAVNIVDGREWAQYEVHCVDCEKYISGGWND